MLNSEFKIGDRVTWLVTGPDGDDPIATIIDIDKGTYTLEFDGDHKDVCADESEIISQCAEPPKQAP